MAYEKDERVKNRAVGALVLLSFVIMFLPAVIKKSNQRFDRHWALSQHFTKPLEQQKTALKETNMHFKSLKIAHVDLTPPKQPVLLLEKAPEKPLIVSQNNTSFVKAPVVKVAQAATPKQAMQVVNVQKSKPLPSPKVALAKAKPLPLKAQHTVHRVAKIQPAQTKHASFAIQMGLFRNKTNAMSLVSQLKKQGYPVQFLPVQTKQGPGYKVLVGKNFDHAEAKQTKVKLMQLTKLDGMIVNTGVS